MEGKELLTALYEDLEVKQFLEDNPSLRNSLTHLLTMYRDSSLVKWLTEKFRCAIKDTKDPQTVSVLLDTYQHPKVVDFMKHPYTERLRERGLISDVVYRVAVYTKDKDAAVTAAGTLLRLYFIRLTSVDHADHALHIIGNASHQISYYFIRLTSVDHASRIIANASHQIATVAMLKRDGEAVKKVCRSLLEEEGELWAST